MNTGGPAFPRPVSTDSATETFANEQDGMTLRDYFAAKAMQSYIHAEKDIPAIDLCKAAYAIADVMLKAREQK